MTAKLYKIFVNYADPVTGLGKSHTVIKRVFKYKDRFGKIYLSTQKHHADAMIRRYGL